jgi:hypothetical protein
MASCWLTASLEAGVYWELTRNTAITEPDLTESIVNVLRAIFAAFATALMKS